VSRRFTLWLLAGLLVLAGVPAAARANDASVRKTVLRQEKKVRPDNVAFAKAINHVKRSNAGKAKRATEKLIADATAYRAALLEQKASSAKVAKGRKALLTALGEQRSGLRSLKTALAKYASHAGQASVKKSVVRALKKLKAGQQDAARAVKLLGLT
jgi:hypothetical protein